MLFRVFLIGVKCVEKTVENLCATLCEATASRVLPFFTTDFQFHPHSCKHNLYKKNKELNFISTIKQH